MTVNDRGGKQSAIPYSPTEVPAKAFLAVSQVLGKGAKTHGSCNWRLISIKDHLDHGIAHDYAYLAGDRTDRHLAHAACRALLALELFLEEEGK